MKIRYVGPSRPGVDIPTAAGGLIIAPHGEDVDVDDELAVRLLEQDTFEAVDVIPPESPKGKARHSTPSAEES